MPSPFPGMDPYLEHPEFFPDLHDAMIAEIRNALQPKLPAGYFAKIRTRAWIEFVEDHVEPDVSVLATHSSNGGVATATAVAPATEVEAQIVFVPLEEQGEKLVEIHSSQGDYPLVTVIEILSPANKRPGRQGRDQYRQKQLEYLSAQVNVIEIDLLRGGQHTTAVPWGRARQVTGHFDYHVCISRYADLQRFTIYPIQLPQHLPRIAIPLRPETPEVNLDLQAVFTKCYDTGPPYRRLEVYEQLLEPAPTPQQARWIQEQLKAGAA